MASDRGIDFYAGKNMIYRWELRVSDRRTMSVYVFSTKFGVKLLMQKIIEFLHILPFF